MYANPHTIKYNDSATEIIEPLHSRRFHSPLIDRKNVGTCIFNARPGGSENLERTTNGPGLIIAVKQRARLPNLISSESIIPNINSLTARIDDSADRKEERGHSRDSTRKSCTETILAAHFSCIITVVKTIFTAPSNTRTYFHCRRSPVAHDITVFEYLKSEMKDLNLFSEDLQGPRDSAILYNQVFSRNLIVACQLVMDNSGIRDKNKGLFRLSLHCLFGRLVYVESHYPATGKLNLFFYCHLRRTTNATHLKQQSRL
jgi:hypothetical protein